MRILALAPVSWSRFVNRLRRSSGVAVSLSVLLVAGVAALLVWEQSLVSADDLSQVKRAFDVNGWVGIFYLATTAAAIYLA